VSPPNGAVHSTKTIRAVWFTQAKRGRPWAAANDDVVHRIFTARVLSLVGEGDFMNLVRQLFVGGGVSIINIAIHALAMTWVIRIARAMGKMVTVQSSISLMQVMIMTVLVLMLAHLCEVAVWALAYWIFGVLPPAVQGSKVYFAFVNYTTLGYGDVVPVERWHLLGPMTAMNGILLFGWSTAVIFEILRRSLAMANFDDKATRM
jgi:hypothetical protein